MNALAASLEQGDKVVEIRNRPDHTLARSKKSVQDLLEKQKERRIAHQADYERQRLALDADYQRQCEEQFAKANELDEQARQVRELWARTVQNREEALRQIRLDFEKQDAAIDKMIRAQEAMLTVLQEE